MKAEFAGKDSVRLEGENDREKELLRKLFLSIHEYNSAIYRKLDEVYPYRNGILGWFARRKRFSILNQYRALGLELRVGMACFHDGSYSLSIDQ